jgi:hypothetical protein
MSPSGASAPADPARHHRVKLPPGAYTVRVHDDLDRYQFVLVERMRG